MNDPAALPAAIPILAVALAR
jgi:hypothetical protein